mgnify:CR=1 FL=1
MAKRPMCLLCFLMVLSLGALELMGIPLIRGKSPSVKCAGADRSAPWFHKSAGRWNSMKTQNFPSLFIWKKNNILSISQKNFQLKM